MQPFTISLSLSHHKQAGRWATTDGEEADASCGHMQPLVGALRLCGVSSAVAERQGDRSIVQTVSVGSVSFRSLLAVDIAGWYCRLGTKGRSAITRGTE